MNYATSCTIDSWSVKKEASFLLDDQKDTTIEQEINLIKRSNLFWNLRCLVNRGQDSVSAYVSPFRNLARQAIMGELDRNLVTKMDHLSLEAWCHAVIYTSFLLQHGDLRLIQQVWEDLLERFFTVPQTDVFTVATYALLLLGHDNQARFKTDSVLQNLLDSLRKVLPDDSTGLDIHASLLNSCYDSSERETMLQILFEKFQQSTLQSPAISTYGSYLFCSNMATRLEQEFLARFDKLLPKESKSAELYMSWLLRSKDPNVVTMTLHSLLAKLKQLPPTEIQSIKTYARPLLQSKDQKIIDNVTRALLHKLRNTAFDHSGSIFLLVELLMAIKTPEIEEAVANDLLKKLGSIPAGNINGVLSYGYPFAIITTKETIGMFGKKLLDEIKRAPSNYVYQVGQCVEAIVSLADDQLISDLKQVLCGKLHANTS